MKDSKRTGFFRHVLAVAPAAAIALAALWLDPFRLDAGTAGQARALWGRVAAFAYPTTQSPKTAIVLLDDLTLQDAGATWPLPYSASSPDVLSHAAVLETIADFGPRAIFVDFTFIYDRDPLASNEFAAKLRDISQTIPVFIAASTNPAFPRPALPSIAETSAPATERFGVRFVGVEAGPDIGSGRAYPLVSPASGLPSAALAMAQSDCARAMCLGSRSDPMDIQWASPNAPAGIMSAGGSYNCAKLQTIGDASFTRSCASLANSPFQRLVQEALSGVYKDNSGPLAAYYAPVLGFGEIGLDASEAALTDAFVFLGSNIAYTNTEESPLYGTVPSTLAHAMAFDNLMTMGDRYLSSTPPFGLSTNMHQSVLIVIVFCFALVFRSVRDLAVGRPGARQAYRALDMQAAAIGSVALAAVEFQYFRVGPYVWAPVLLAAFSGTYLWSMVPSFSRKPASVQLKDDQSA